MGAPGWLKKINDFGNKVVDGAKKVFNTTGKVMDKLKPVVDVVTDFIPGVGDTVDKVYDGVRKAVDVGEKVTNKLSGSIKSSPYKGTVGMISRPAGVISRGPDSVPNKVREKIEGSNFIDFGQPPKQNKPSFLNNQLN